MIWLSALLVFGTVGVILTNLTAQDSQLHFGFQQMIHARIPWILLGFLWAGCALGIASWTGKRARLFGGADPVELNGQWVRTGVDLVDIAPNPGRWNLQNVDRIDYPRRRATSPSAHPRELTLGAQQLRRRVGKCPGSAELGPNGGCRGSQPVGFGSPDVTLNETSGELEVPRILAAQLGSVVQGYRNTIILDRLTRWRTTIGRVIGHYGVL